MKLIIALGNPGVEYKNTRHNAGFLVAEALQKRISNFQFLIFNQKTASLRVKIFKSDRFMNDSGSFVKKVLTDYRLRTTDLYIVHDDLDIKLGEFKIQKGHGPKDHNGLNDIYQKLGSDGFWHVRIGIDNRNQEAGIREKGEEYVLQNFTNEEKTIIDGVIKEVIHDLERRIKSEKSE